MEKVLPDSPVWPRPPGVRRPQGGANAQKSKCFHETFKESCTKLFATKIGILDQMTPPPSPLESWEIQMKYHFAFQVNTSYEFVL